MKSVKGIGSAASLHPSIRNHLGTRDGNEILAGIMARIFISEFPSTEFLRRSG